MSKWPLDFKVGMTLMMVVLTVAVLVLALTDSGNGGKTVVADSALRGKVADVSKRIGALERSTAQLHATLLALTGRVGALASRIDRIRPATTGAGRLTGELRSLSAQLQTFNSCLFQIQKQIDDLQGFGLNRKSLRKRVSGQCEVLLQPQYAGR